MNIKIKYCGSPELKMIAEGEWVDCYACGDTRLKAGESALIPLGSAMALPDGYEANVVPRSSTFAKWGVIQTNHYGVIDSSYRGNDDVWRFPVYALRDTFIPDGTRICQFRINKTMRNELGEIIFTPADDLGNANRGGFGSTGEN